MVAKIGTNADCISCWPNFYPMQVAFYLAREITQVLDAIPWVRCASGNVSLIFLFICNLVASVINPLSSSNVSYFCPTFFNIPYFSSHRTTNANTNTNTLKGGRREIEREK